MSHNLGNDDAYACSSILPILEAREIFYRHVVANMVLTSFLEDDRDIGFHSIGIFSCEKWPDITVTWA